MLQFGYKEDLLNYYSAPDFPFDYATWYERNEHKKNSNINEKVFRSKYAVEQWLTMHYIFGSESDFPILFHNDFSDSKIIEFEQIFPRYFFIAHPEDIKLRASKFESAKSYFNTQCYSTYESVVLLEKAYPQYCIANVYSPKGINKKIYKYIKLILNLRFAQWTIKLMPSKLKKVFKSLIS